MVDEQPDYEVGYGKPPRHSRWKKGSSGNPRGRPRKREICAGEKSFNPYLNIVLEEMQRMIPVRENGEEREISIFEALVRSLFANAIRGSARERRFALELMKQAQTDHIHDLARQQDYVEKYKAAWPAMAAEAKLRGGPIPLPRPEHLHFDLPRGVNITGPANHQEDKSWKDLKSRLTELRSLLAKASTEEAIDESPGVGIEVLERVFRDCLREVPEGWDWQEDA